MEKTANKKTVILGATDNPARYAYVAAQRLHLAGIPTEYVSRKKGTLFGKAFLPFGEKVHDVDTITLYLNPQNQVPYYQYIVSLKPRRVIFNPGTENPELESILSENGIESLEACTLVMLSVNAY